MSLVAHNRTGQPVLASRSPLPLRELFRVARIMHGLGARRATRSHDVLDRLLDGRRSQGHALWLSHRCGLERRAPLHKSLPPSVAARQGGDRQEQSSTLHAQHSARMPHASRLTLTCSPFGDPATVSVADTGAGLCVWVNRATGQLGNWATGQLVPSGDNGATGRRPASATSTQPSYLPTILSSYLPTAFQPSACGMHRVSVRREA